MKKIVIAFTVLMVLQVALVCFLINRNQKKIVYADAIRLFNGYKFKTDLEKMSEPTLDRLKRELDSVEVILKVNSQDEASRQLVAQKQQNLTQGYSLINKEINEKVWERLNPVINQFGKENSIELLIGANGMGTVLYASDAKDITGDLIKYANVKYEKGN